MNFCLVFVVLCGAFSTSHGFLKVPTKSELLSYLDRNAEWKAADNYVLSLDPIEFLKRLGLILKKIIDDSPTKPDDESRNTTTTSKDRNLPSEYDLRIVHPYCPSITKIKDQSSCGSCWAVSTASVLSDWSCISTNGNETIELSAEDPLTCCRNCRADWSDGCRGGYVDEAMEYHNKEGMVTGGSYGSQEGCLPYSIPPCTSKYRCGNQRAKRCKHVCSNKAYTKNSFHKDKRIGSGKYKLLRGEAAMQSAMYNGSSIVVTFMVYYDFLAYESGVYTKTKIATPQGYHAVRCMGWGVQNNTKYWLCANSWGTEWGEKGYFKFKRGSNECGIENQSYGYQSL